MLLDLTVTGVEDAPLEGRATAKDGTVVAPEITAVPEKEALPVTVRPAAALSAPVMPRVPPTRALLVTCRLARVEAPAESACRVEAPPTDREVPKDAPPEVVRLEALMAAALRAARVEAPVTAKVLLS